MLSRGRAQETGSDGLLEQILDNSKLSRGSNRPRRWATERRIGVAAALDLNILWPRGSTPAGHTAALGPSGFFKALDLWPEHAQFTPHPPRLLTWSVPLCPPFGPDPFPHTWPGIWRRNRSTMTRSVGGGKGAIDADVCMIGSVSRAPQARV